MKSTQRAQTKIIRVLTLLERMTGFMQPKTVPELFQALRDDYQSVRTMYRDLELLVAMGLIVEAGSRPIERKGPETKQYEVSLPRAKRLQAIAQQMTTASNAS